MEPVTCPACRHRFEDPGDGTCPACGTSRTAAIPLSAEGPGGAAGGGWAPPPPPPPPPAPGNSVPFEDPSLPFFERLWRTVQLAISDPMRLFSSVEAGDIGAPLLYGTIIGTVATIFGSIWQLALTGLGLLAEEGQAAEFVVGTGVYLLVMLFSPILAALAVLVHAGIYHVALLLLGGGRQGYAVTLRAVAYGNTPALFAIVPLCGGIVGGLWAMALVIIGGKLGHDAEWWKAIVGYFLPTLLCCCLLFWLFGMIGLLGGLAQT